jgi:hypothetical protein
MNVKTCTACLTAKAHLQCVHCENPLCKSCADFVDEGSFSFFKKLPEGVKLGAYCPQCFEANVAKEKKRYDDLLRLAADVEVYLLNQTKESRRLNREEPEVKVQDCPDREEALMRLAFQAAELGYNCITDVDVAAKKIRDGTYQYAVYNGKGIPTMSRVRRSK